MTDLSVLIVNYNSWRLSVAAVESVRAHPPLDEEGRPLSYEVVVVDNASPLRDPEAEAELEELLGEVGGELVRHDRNGGYSAGMNLAYARSSGRWVLCSNPDVLYTPGCLTRLGSYLARHVDAGAVAPAGFLDEGFEARLPPNILPTLGDLWRTTRAGLSPAGVAAYSRRRTRDALRVWLAREPVDLDMLSGCSFLMRRDVVEEIGFFDERFPLYYEDTDLSVRLRRRGLRIVHVPDARLVHFYNRSGQTASEESMRRYWISRRAYYRKYYGWLGGCLVDLGRALLCSRPARRWLQRPPHPEVREAEERDGKPSLPVPAGVEGFLVEISPDPRFYLAAGVLGEGDRWTPGDALWRCLGPTTYYFRLCDIGGSEPRQIGVYRYTRLSCPEMEVGAAGEPIQAEAGGER